MSLDPRLIAFAVLVHALVGAGGVYPAAAEPRRLELTSSLIGFPLAGMKVPVGEPLTITGAGFATGTLVRVEVSTDGGASWIPAAGATEWSLPWTPTVRGIADLRSRAIDAEGNVEGPSRGTAIHVGAPELATCPCTLWPPSAVPASSDSNDPRPLEVGVRFRSDRDGFIDALRYFKSAAHAGTHVAHLWTAGGELIATAEDSGAAFTGWHEIEFQSPIPVARDTPYVASVFMPAGHFALDEGAFSSGGVHRPPLHAPQSLPDAGNGVFAYGPASSFPSTSLESSYGIDVRFSVEDAADLVPPRVIALAPGGGVAAVAVGTAIRVTFREPIDPGTLLPTTFSLRDPAGTAVAASARYDAATQSAILEPRALAYATTYRAILGTGVRDLAGNALAESLAWHFTTVPRPADPPDEGPGGPIVVLASMSHPFSRYLAEILRAEGLNAFTVRELSRLDARTFAGFDIALLGDAPVDAAQAAVLAEWVAAGGKLIAMRPDPRLSGLFGLEAAGDPLADRYLRVDTGSAPGEGIVGAPLQYHGEADTYRLSPDGSTRVIAWIHAAADQPTPHPAVTLRDVGPNGGQAAAFTYDLSRSVVTTRQGNPAWAGQERDGNAPRRANDLFFGAAGYDPQPDWVDFENIAIPQADEQQRLLANLLFFMTADRTPLPRFWYLPRELKAVVIMTGDDHGSAGMATRFETCLSRSEPGCSLEDWECVRGTGYLTVGPPFDAIQAAHYQELGFEIGIHLSTRCLNTTPADLAVGFDDQLAAFASTYAGVDPPVSNRTHCVAWGDYASQAGIEAARGIRLDTNYYYWPAEWVGDRAGLFTGSGFPMRFAHADGTIIDAYQAATQFTDDAAMSIPRNLDAVLDRALGPEGWYGAFTCNVHMEMNPNHVFDAIVTSAQARGVPIISARQMLTWLDGRNASSIRVLAWSGAQLDFAVTQAAGARNLRGLLPAIASGDTLRELTRDGEDVAVRFETVKGRACAWFDATSGFYTARYGPPAETVGIAGRAVGPALTLDPVVPQPIRSDARIGYHLPAAGPVRISIHGVRGNLVRTLLVGSRPAGAGTVTWDRRDDGGRAAPAGVYLVGIQAGGARSARRLVLIR